MDSSFFPDQSYLIATHIILTKGKQKLVSVNFISSIALLYFNTYSAELYSTLAIVKLTEYLIMLSYTKLLSYQIKVDSDCSSVLSFLPSTPKIISNNILLHQIKREIL